MSDPQRIILDGAEPYASALAAILLDRHQVDRPSGRVADLRDVTVVVPGARSGRRILDHLSLRASASELPWVPPSIVTPGRAIELMQLERESRDAPDIGERGVTASSFERLSAWCAALGRISPEDREELGIGTDTPLGRWVLAELLDSLHRELSGEALSIGDAAERLPSRRVALAAGVEERYVDSLSKYDRVDGYRQRRLALQLSAPLSGGPIYLVGLFDLPGLLRRYLWQWPGPVTAIVCGAHPEEDAYDSFGVARPDRWGDLHIAVPERSVAFARDAESQASQVVDQVERWATAGAEPLGVTDPLGVEDVAIGVVDAAAALPIQRRLAERDVKTRSGAGQAFARCGPARLIAAMRGLTQELNFEGVSVLMRHPDIERWLQSTRPIANDGAATDGTARADAAAAPDTAASSPDEAATIRDDRSDSEQYLAALDRYRAEFLPSTWVPGQPVVAELSAPLQRLSTLLAPLVVSDERRSLPHWSDSIRSVLESVYSARTLEESHAIDREVAEALALVRDALDEMGAIDPVLAPRLSASDALAILSDSLQDASLTDPQREPSVELIGWLELLLDDAPRLIVTSVNEPGLPAPPSIDPFLPEPARRSLGLNDHSRRYARDAAIATGLQARTRGNADIVWIATRLDVDGRPALPSRLLLACDAVSIAKRIARFGSPAEETVAVGMASDRGLLARFEPPAPIAPPVLSRLRVTAFRDYLACPYRFYLRHVLKLDSVDDRATELDARAFGTLVHEVLARFGADHVMRDSRDPTALAAYLIRTLDSQARDRYGAQPLPAIRIQLAGARQRLAAFADWQVAWRRQGWQIRAAELGTAAGGVPLDVDGEPFLLTGTIDRIDVHEQTGETLILDYKTSESGEHPDRVHRKRSFAPDPARPGKRRAVQEWVDLQLPLYRQLAAAHGFDSAAKLGYLVLPRDLRNVGLLSAEWSSAELEQADEVASSIVRALRDKVFWPPAERPPAFSEVYSPICQDGLLVEGADEVLNAVDSEGGDVR